MKYTLINKLNKIVSLDGGELGFYGTMRAGDGAVLKITKNKIHIEKDRIIEGLNTKECIIYFDDFMEIYGEGKFFELYELAKLKVPNYKDDEEELIDRIDNIADGFQQSHDGFKLIQKLIKEYKND